MEDRRVDLGLTWREVAADADVTVETIRALRRGANEPNKLTKSGIERALRWESGSVDAILAGGEPTPKVERTPEEILEGVRARQDAIDRSLDRLDMDIAWAKREAPDELALALELIRRRRAG